jgi:hypothetical protein
MRPFALSAAGEHKVLRRLQLGRLQQVVEFGHPRRPGAIDAGLGDALFWWSLGVLLAIALVAAFPLTLAAAFPLNRWLIARGRGHAVVHQHHAR